MVAWEPEGRSEAETIFPPFLKLFLLISKIIKDELIFLAALFQGSISSFLGIERQFGGSSHSIFILASWALDGSCASMSWAALSRCDLRSCPGESGLDCPTSSCSTSSTINHITTHISWTLTMCQALNVLHKSFYLNPKTTHEKGTINIPLFQMSLLRFRKER